MTELTHEARFVFACARVGSSAASSEEIAELARTIVHWDEVAMLATRHGLAPATHRRLVAARLSLPPAIEAALWARAQWAARRSERLADELESVACALSRARVRFAPFKGPLLAERVYGSVAPREFGDLDILVAPTDVRDAWAVLGTLGYEPQAALDPARWSLWLASALRHELPMVDRRRKLVVELQWRANPDIAVPALHEPQWWDRAPVIRWRGTMLRGIPDDEFLFALLVHGSKHCWASADWLVDIAAIASEPGAPWKGMMRLASEHGAVRRVALGLEVAHRLLHVRLPAPVEEFVRRADIAPLADETVASLVAVAAPTASTAEGLRKQLRLYDHDAQRVLCMVSLLAPTPGDWSLVRLPRPLFFLYWLIRPLRLFAKYVLRIRPREAALPPRLEDDDGHRVGQVQAAVARPHRQP